MSKKQKTDGNRTAGIIKILIYAVLVLFCIFVFLLYGKKQRSIEAAASPNPSAAAVQTETVKVTPSPIQTEELPNAFLNSTIFMPKFSMTPKLMPLQELLKSSMNCAKNTTQS